MTAAAYTIPAHRRDILDMKADATLLDLRNRVIPAEDWAPSSTPTSIPLIHPDSIVAYQRATDDWYGSRPQEGR